MNAGDVVYVLYHGDPGVYHTRLLTAHVEGDEWPIVTPDGDCYPGSIMLGMRISRDFGMQLTGGFPEAFL